MKTGNSGTISFGTQAFTGSWNRIGAWQPSRDKIETSHLGTTGYKTFIPGDLDDPGEVTLEVQFDPTASLPSMADPETVTITYPKKVGTNTAASLAGSGFITKAGTPELRNGQVMVQEITVAFDGITGPAFTKEAA